MLQIVYCFALLAYLLTADCGISLAVLQEIVWAEMSVSKTVGNSLERDGTIIIL